MNIYARNSKMADRDGQTETVRAGTTWVDIQDSVSLADFWLMRVARNHRMKTGRNWVNV